MRITLKQLIEQLKEYEYKSFMGIEAFPSYSLVTKEVSLEDVESSGVISVVMASYQAKKWIHTFGINVNLCGYERMVKIWKTISMLFLIF